MMINIYDHKPSRLYLSYTLLMALTLLNIKHHSKRIVKNGMTYKKKKKKSSVFLSYFIPQMVSSLREFKVSEMANKNFIFKYMYLSML